MPADVIFSGRSKSGGERGKGRERKEREGRWQKVDGDAFNARQRAVVVAIGLASSSTRFFQSLFNVVSAAQDALDQITDEKRPP